MMRNVNYRFWGLSVIMTLVCLAGCKKEEQLVLSVTRAGFQPQQVEKTYIGRGLQDTVVNWTNTENVYIDGTGITASSCPLTIQGDKVQVTPSGTASAYYALYPASNTTVSTSGGSVNIPSSQYYTEDGNGNQIINAPMAAYLTAANGTLFFRNVASLLRIAVMNGNENGKTFTVKRISVSASNNVNLSGSLPFTFSGNTQNADINTPDPASASGVTLTGCDTNATLGNSNTIAPGAMKVFNIVVAPYSTDCELTIKVTGTLQGGSVDTYTIVQNTARNLLHGEVAVQFFATNFEK